MVSMDCFHPQSITDDEKRVFGGSRKQCQPFLPQLHHPTSPTQLAMGSDSQRSALAYRMGSEILRPEPGSKELISG